MSKGGEKMNEEIDLLNKDVWNVIIGDQADKFDVVRNEIVGDWNHGNLKEAVVKSKASGRFYQSSYKDTPEDSGFDDMNGKEANFFEVVPEEKTITVYVKKQ